MNSLLLQERSQNADAASWHGLRLESVSGAARRSRSLGGFPEAASHGSRRRAIAPLRRFPRPSSINFTAGSSVCVGERVPFKGRRAAT